MNLLRTIVSGKKKRYQEEGYNLDLTYITPRLVAMSFPGGGLSQLYRNPLKSVSKLLNEQHAGNYVVYNLSGRHYDYSKFQGRIVDFSWPDHYPPPIDLLFRACHSIHEWLFASTDNIVVTHCMAGKGRTGTLISCYLLYCGRLESPEAALLYYKRKRFHTGGGVTQPAQRRYVDYFYQILNGFTRTPYAGQLAEVVIRTAPHMASRSSRPYVNIFSEGKIVFTSKETVKERQHSISDNWRELKCYSLGVINSVLYIQGDILCKLKHRGKWKSTDICRSFFNTAFIPPEGVLSFNKTEIDPDKFRISHRVSDDFCIYFIFNVLCRCKKTRESTETCETCLSRVPGAEREKWEYMQENVLRKRHVDPSQQLFGSSELDDIDAQLSRPLSVSLSDYSDD